MNGRNRQSIKEYLQQSEVQMRIWQDIQKARSSATVTISRAASLFNFRESQLREWERRGLLETERTTRPSQDGRDSTGHRQYSPAELDKLAIISELTRKGSYAAGEITSEVYEIWDEIARENMNAQPEAGNLLPQSIANQHKEDRRAIDTREEQNNQQEAWRYFVSQALRISLLLVCQDIPDTLAGLILPLEDRKLAGKIGSEEIHRLGPSLVGWLGRNRSFHVFLTENPTFDFPTDFRLETLKQAEHEDNRVLDNAIIVVQRKARPLSFSRELVDAVQRVLHLVYQRGRNWKPCFEAGGRDWIYQVHDLERASSVSGDIMFNILLERIIDLGGRTDDGQNRWSFCALLVPNDSHLPLQQQSLIVRAQTRNSPYEIGRTTSDPTSVVPEMSDSLSLKAFQSGQVVSLAEVLPGQTMVTFSLPNVEPGSSGIRMSRAIDSSEKLTRSNMAIPLVGEYGISLAVIYIASEQTEAFSTTDLRSLRIITRMVEELLLVSEAPQQTAGGLSNIMSNPGIADSTFQSFASETDFVTEIEVLLTQIQNNGPASLESAENVSIISVDIDDQSSIALKYGNRTARNLSQQMGLRISDQTQLSNRYSSGKIFHISADKYFLLVRISLEEARALARRLHVALSGNYRILPLSAATGRFVPSKDMLMNISDVTVHLGVASYTLEKLDELLKRYSASIATKAVTATIMSGVERTLNEGKSEGGNCIASWDWTWPDGSVKPIILPNS